jgi:hypothetical protein
MALIPASWAFATLAGQVLLRGHSFPVAGVAAGILVATGVVGLAPLFGGRALGSAWAALAWAGLVWFGLPLFSGDDSADAFQAAVAVVRAPPVPSIATVPRPLPPESVDVAPAVEREDPDEEPPGSSIVLPYEGDGRRMRVSVTLTGPREDLDVWMLFDTGATFSTLDRATLKRLGLSPDDGPQLTLNTANGAVSTSLVLLDRIRLDGRPADGVSIAVCDACSGDGYVGLLGLNVTGRYRVAIDHDVREVELTSLPVDDRTVDVGRWLELSGRARTYPGIKTEVEVTGTNLSRRTILEAVASVSCSTGEFAIQLDDIPAYSEGSTRIDLPGAHDCDAFTLKLLSARW